MHREIGKRGSLDMIRNIVMINEEDEEKEEENVKKRKRKPDDSGKKVAAEDAAEVFPDGFGMHYHGVFYRNTCMQRAAVYHEVAVRLYGRSGFYRCYAYDGNIWVRDHHACR